MNGTELLARLRSIHVDRRLGLAAVVAASLATAAVTYGLLHNDIVTAISALPFVPAALLLVAIGLSFEHPDEHGPGPGGSV
jgi:hypothetical protein